MPARAALDVSHLPELTYGPRNVSWWATLGFMVIEGTTLAVVIATYFYLSKNFPSWPPPPTPLPDLLVPTINLVVLLLAIVPMHLAGRAGKLKDLAGVKRWLLAGLLFSIAASVLRIYEFGALNTWWDEHAYGSAAWAVLAIHASLLFVDVLETGVILAIFVVGPVEEKHFSDADDAAFYQWFLSLSNVVVYAVLFLWPRF